MNTISSLLYFIGDYVFSKISELSVANYTGSSGTISLTAGTVEQIPLTTAKSAYNNSDYFVLYDGGIQIKKKGLYRITASAYIESNDTTTNRFNVFIKQASSSTAASNTYANATEIGAGFAPRQTGNTTNLAGGVQTTIVVDSSYDCDTFFLACRTVGGPGTAHTNNDMTFMTIEYIRGLSEE